MLMRPRSHADLLCSEMVMKGPRLQQSQRLDLLKPGRETVQRPRLIAEQGGAIAGDEVAECLVAGHPEAHRPVFEP